MNLNGQYAEDVAYDKNGNITTLKRYGQEELGQPIEIDDLTYAYTGNQLQSVTDATNNAEGFNDGNTVGVDYVYDSFGNITQDKNKKITNVKYNHLNLPTEVVFNTGKINYTYDAAGTRLKKQVQPTAGTTVTTDYINGFQYKNNVLQFFPHAEGYVKRNANNSYLYVYQYKDHLGNVRLSYADVNGNGTIQPASEILEENNYYPFGLKHKGYNEIANSNRSEAAEKYKFGGKELNDELGLDLYDFGARNYDAALGRWLNIDPLAEEFISVTPYNYTLNNPISNIDPDGRFTLEGLAAQNFVRDLQSQLAINDRDRDCDSCKTQADWDAYYQQARNTASMIGDNMDDVDWGFSERMSVVSDEDGHRIYYLDGEKMDLRQYSNRAHAFGSVFGEALLIEGGGRFLKFLSSFFKSGGDNVGLIFNKGVTESFTKHAFAGGRHADLGLSVETMASKGMNLVERNMHLLKAGDNTLIGNINGIQKSFKAFVQDGKVMSVNMYPGVSNRVTQGTTINFGNVTW